MRGAVGFVPLGVGLCRSGLYYQPREADPEQLALMRRIWRATGRGRCESDLPAVESCQT